REALAVVAGTGGLDGGVQGQQVGLVGDGVDDLHLLGDVRHRIDGFLDRATTLTGLVGRLGGHVVGDLGVLGVLRHGGGNLLDGGAGLLDAGGLLGGVLAQGGGSGGHLFG